MWPRSRASTITKKTASRHSRPSPKRRSRASGRSSTSTEDFTFVCPTEIVEFAKLAKQFEERDAVLLGGSSDNEFVKLAWRREHKDLDKLNHYSFGDVKGELIDQLGVRDKEAGVALRATFIVDPDNTIQHVSVNNLNVGRSPEEILRILDGLQTDELCPCNRAIGGATL